MTEVWLLGAKSIKEETLEPWVRVVWVVQGRKSDSTLVYGDQNTLFFFDEAQRVLHSIYRGSYSACPITNITSSDEVTRFFIQIMPRHVQWNTAIPAQVEEHLLKIVPHHEPTLRHILSLKTRLTQ